MYSIASLTVLIFSASSSGISRSNASSNCITNSTTSSESAPRSSWKLAPGVTSASSTCSCSTMICLTFSSTAMRVSPRLCRKLLKSQGLVTKLTPIPIPTQPNHKCDLLQVPPAYNTGPRLGNTTPLATKRRRCPEVQVYQTKPARKVCGTPGIAPVTDKGERNGYLFELRPGIAQD